MPTASPTAPLPRPPPRVRSGGWPTPPPRPCATSRPLEPAEAGRDQSLHAADLGLEMPSPACADLIGPPAVVAVEGFDHAVGLEPGYRSIQRARAEANPGDRRDVLDHRVAVLGSAGQAGQDQELRVVADCHISPHAIS